MALYTQALFPLKIAYSEVIETFNYLVLQASYSF